MVDKKTNKIKPTILCGKYTEINNLIQIQESKWRLFKHWTVTHQSGCRCKNITSLDAFVYMKSLSVYIHNQLLSLQGGKGISDVSFDSY